MQPELTLVIRCPDEKLCRSIHRALLPEIRSMPGKCSGSIEGGDTAVAIRIVCEKTNRLRAVVNSVLPIIAALLESVES